jgi:periplasmic divalent cation tolerance protein
MSTTGVLLALCTCPDLKTAEEIAGLLVSEGLAACVSLTPGVVSVFEWKGELDRQEEVLLHIKTTAASYRRLEQRILELHPYELPEIIATPVEQGLATYLDWVRQCTQGSRSD